MSKFGVAQLHIGLGVDGVEAGFSQLEHQFTGLAQTANDSMMEISAAFKGAQSSASNINLSPKLDSKGVEKGAKEVVKSVEKMKVNTERKLQKLKENSRRTFDGLFVASAATSVALFAGLGSATKGAADFELQMRKVDSILKLSPASFEALKEQVLSLEGISQTPEELAEGLYEISSAGFLGAEGLEVLRVSAQAATAGMTDVKTLADGLTSSLGAYGLAADEAQRFTDIIFKTVDLGKIESPDFASNIAKLAPEAATLGIGFDELGAAIATMTKKGVRAESTMTSIASLIAQIQKPSQQAQQEFEKLGISFGAGALEGKGLINVLREIQEKTGGDKDAFARLLPDRESRKALSTLLGTDGGQEFFTIFEDIKNSAGSTQEAYNRVVASVLVKSKLIGAELKKLFIGLGDAFLPAINSIAKSTIGFLQYLNSFSPQAKKQMAILAGAIASVAGAIGIIVPAVMGAKAAFLSMMVAESMMVALATSASMVGAFFSTWVAPIAAAGVAIYGLWKAYDSNFAGLKKFVVNFASDVSRAFSRVKQAFVESGKRLVDFYEKNEALQSLVSTIASFFEGSFSIILESFGSLAINVIESILSLVETLVRALGDSVKFFDSLLKGDLIQAVKDFVVGVLHLFEGLGESLFRIFGDWAHDSMENFVSIVDEQIERLKRRIFSTSEEIRQADIGSGLSSSIKTHVLKAKGYLRELGAEGAKVASGLVAKSKSFIGQKIEDFRTAYPDFIPAPQSNALKPEIGAGVDSSSALQGKLSIGKTDGTNFVGESLAKAALSLEGVYVEPNSCAKIVREAAKKGLGEDLPISLAPFDQKAVAERARDKGYGSAYANSLAGSDVGQEVPLSGSRAGDLVFFDGGKDGRGIISHVGILTDSAGMMIDASTRLGKVVHRSVFDIGQPIYKIIRPFATMADGAGKSMDGMRSSIEAQALEAERLLGLEKEREKALGNLYEQSLKESSAVKAKRKLYQDLSVTFEKLFKGASKQEQEKFFEISKKLKEQATFAVEEEKAKAFHAKQKAILDVFREQEKSLGSISQEQQELNALAEKNLRLRQSLIENEASSDQIQAFDAGALESIQALKERHARDRQRSAEQEILPNILGAFDYLDQGVAEGSVSLEVARERVAGIAEQFSVIPGVAEEAQLSLERLGETARATSPISALEDEIEAGAKDSIYGFFDGIIVKGQSMGDALKSAFNSFISSALSGLAKLGANKLINSIFGDGPKAGSKKSGGGGGGFFSGLFSGLLKGVLGLFGFKHDGGLVGGGKFSSSMRKILGLRSDELPTVLQRGELVIPRREVRNISQSRVSNQVSNSYNINPYAFRSNSSFGAFDQGFALGF